MMKINKLAAACVIGLFSVASQAQSNWYNTSIVSAGTYTSSFASADVTNAGGKCTHILVNVTSTTGVAVVPHVEGKDQLTGDYYDILVGSPISDADKTVLTVCQGGSNIKGQSTNDMLPYKYRIEFIFKGTGSVDMSVESNYNS